MEPDLHAVNARDRERFAHSSRLPIFPHRLNILQYGNQGAHACMLDSGAGMTRPFVERPATQPGEIPPA
jgi:hypothetical protein